MNAKKQECARMAPVKTWMEPTSVTVMKDSDSHQINKSAMVGSRLLLITQASFEWCGVLVSVKLEFTPHDMILVIGNCVTACFRHKRV